MKLSIFISLAQLALATPNAKPGSCNSDNCARAVTGTRLGAAHVTMARMDCTRLLAASPTAQTVPAYIANCADFSHYSSACSCWGAVSPTCHDFDPANLIDSNHTSYSLCWYRSSDGPQQLWYLWQSVWCRERVHQRRLFSCKLHRCSMWLIPGLWCGGGTVFVLLHVRWHRFLRQ